MLLKNRSELGQGLVEYALLILLVAVVVVVALSLLGVDIANVFNSMESTLTS
ncbi:MAG: pilus assembly protein [Anaerolineales bacterium]|nr:pilus assembly protein [Anaerolineales bacterium]